MIFVISLGLHEFDSLKNSEVNDFRWKMKMLADEVAQSRQNLSWLQKMDYQYPPRLASSPNPSSNIMSRLRDGNFVLVTKFENTEVIIPISILYVFTLMWKLYNI